MTTLADDDRAAIIEIFAARVRGGATPGSYFILFDRNGPLVEAGFGERSIGGDAPDRDTAFRIASCTKSFTAATLLILRDRGELNLDDPVTRFVPALRGTLPAIAPEVPTVRMLMTMSGGLPTDDPWGDRQESLTVDEFTGILRRGVRFQTVPGTDFEYSNLGYALLGQVIEAVTGDAYPDVVARELLAPLGLDDVGFTVQTVDAPRLAVGHRKSDRGWLPLPFSTPGVFSSIGGVFATPENLMRWARWLGSGLDVDAPLPGPLSPSSRREMQQIQRSIGRGADAPSTLSEGYGFGLMVDDDPVSGRTAHHSGGYPGFSTHMRWNVASGLGIVAFENATYSGAKLPAVAALELAIESGGPVDLTPVPWPETLELQAAADGLLCSWDDSLATRIFSENVALDVPFPERSDAIAAVVAAAGVVDDVAHGTTQVRVSSPAQVSWLRHGAHGTIRCEILVDPVVPARIQKFTVALQSG